MEPHFVFDANKFIALFVDELLPTAFVNHVWETSEEQIPEHDELWPLTFNPLALAYVSPSEYAALSPYAMEPDIEHTIVVC